MWSAFMREKQPDSMNVAASGTKRKHIFFIPLEFKKGDGVNRHPQNETKILNTYSRYEVLDEGHDAFRVRNNLESPMVGRYLVFIACIGYFQRFVKQTIKISV